MNLEQTIADLEKQAAQYAEAAKTLRSLLGQGSNQTAASKPTSGRSAASRTAPRKAGAKKQKQGGKKAAVTAETRAKISAALRASHAARKAQPASSGSPDSAA